MKSKKYILDFYKDVWFRFINRFENYSNVKFPLEILKSEYKIIFNKEPSKLHEEWDMIKEIAEKGIEDG